MLTIIYTIFYTSCYCLLQKPEYDLKPRKFVKIYVGTYYVASAFQTRQCHELLRVNIDELFELITKLC